MNRLKSSINLNEHIEYKDNDIIELRKILVTEVKDEMLTLDERIQQRKEKLQKERQLLTQNQLENSDNSISLSSSGNGSPVFKKDNDENHKRALTGDWKDLSQDIAKYEESDKVGLNLFHLLPQKTMTKPKIPPLNFNQRMTVSDSINWQEPMYIPLKQSYVEEEQK